MVLKPHMSSPPKRPVRRRSFREREKELTDALKFATDRVAVLTHWREVDRKDFERALAAERMTARAAQRGLVPYVRALQQFNEWLRSRPALLEELEPVLRELGLFGIKLGYDPDQDIAVYQADSPLTRRHS